MKLSSCKIGTLFTSLSKKNFGILIKKKKDVIFIYCSGSSVKDIHWYDPNEEYRFLFLSQAT